MRVSPPFRNGKKLKQLFVPQFETAFYVHKFAAGTKPGLLLYRAYPGPWRVFRAVEGGGMECVAEYDERPEMRDVAMEFFSCGLTSSNVVVSSGEAPELSSDNTRYYHSAGADPEVRGEGPERGVQGGGEDKTSRSRGRSHGVLRD